MNKSVVRNENDKQVTNEYARRNEIMTMSNKSNISATWNSTFSEANVTTSNSSWPASSSPIPCSPGEVAMSPGDCVGSVDRWLEEEAIGGFRTWQLAGIILAVMLAITIALCCCIRFRVPRTKQEIQADYVRKKITRNFRKELSKINNDEMDEMDLRRALEQVRAGFAVENESQKRQREANYDESLCGFRAKINSVLHAINLRFSRNEPRDSNNVA